MANRLARRLLVAAAAQRRSRAASRFFAHATAQEALVKQIAGGQLGLRDGRKLFDIITEHEK